MHQTQDLIAGGTDTSAKTVEWAMSELLNQPHLIQKAIEELDGVIGREIGRASCRERVLMSV